MKAHTIACVLAMAAALAAQDEVHAYKAARIWPAGGAPIEQGVMVVVGGKVATLGGADTAIPEGAKVHDLGSAVITPGLVDASFHRAGAPEDRNEQSSEVTPHMRAADAYDPLDPQVVRARKGGVTTLHFTPGNRAVIGGLGVVVKTAPGPTSANQLADEVSLRITMGAEPSMGNRAIRGGTVDSIYYRRPTTRMGVVWEVRRAFSKAQDYQQRTIAEGTPADPAMEVLVRALQGKVTVITTARAEQDIRTALRLADEFGYKTAIDEGVESHVLVDELAAAGTTVLVGAPSADRVSGAGGSDGAEPRWSTLSRLATAGVPFVVTTGGNTGALPLAQEAMFAVRFGLTPEQALDAVTIRPARLLGVDARIGSLAPGKDADFVIWSTDPFDPTAVATAVHVNGTRIQD